MAVERALRSSASTIAPPVPTPQARHVNANTTDDAPFKDAGAEIPTGRLKRKAEPTTPPARKPRLRTPGMSQEKSHSHGTILALIPTTPPTGTAAANDFALSLDRPAQPHRTNAPVITPRGSRLVTYPQNTFDESPSKIGLPRPTITTEHILEDACAHLIKTEPKMQSLIEKHYCRVFCPEGLNEECDPFKSLCSTIMGQQVSGAAASSIKRKFVGLFHESVEPQTALPTPEDAQKDGTAFPTPLQVSACSIPFLRQAGLSERKAEYIKGLAEKFASGELSAAMLMKATDEEVLEKLTAVRGLGKWSVEMFACFGLKRMDIFSTGDLGVQRGMAAFVGKDVKKLKGKGGGKWKYMSEKDMLMHSEKFAPYRLVPLYFTCSSTDSR